MLQERKIGPVEILFGLENGKYPQGNSFVIRGKDRTAIVDPSLGVVARKENLPDVDLVLLSHVHEDHVAGVSLFPQAACFCHELDALGMESMDGMLTIYGFEGELRKEFEQKLKNDFYYKSRKQVNKFVDGDVIDLGGVTVTVIHTPGHTRGHCCFKVDWHGNNDSFIYLGDIELTGFGPYYGDAWSNLLDFEHSLEKLKHITAKWWLTFHHKGLIETREEFLVKLASFRQMIDVREANLLDFIREPRSIEEIVSHRFVYRPSAQSLMIDQVELRSMSMHLQRLEQTGRVIRIDEKFTVA